jgi:hypothetical protein
MRKLTRPVPVPQSDVEVDTRWHLGRCGFRGRGE